MASENDKELRHYPGNPNVKNDGVEQEWTLDMIREYKKCRKDPIYFIENYVQIISLDEGLVYFKPYDYQKRLIDTFEGSRFNVVLSSRQSGKSITVIAYLLWYCLFRSEKTVALLANKHSTAKEMLGRLTLMLENIPFFLQPGCKALNKTSVEFSNNSRIISESSSSGSIRGYTVDLLVLDEFAFAPKATEFYTSTYPVISSGKKSRVIIISTANGIGNQFHKIWEGAVQNTNEYKASRIDWWDVPGRDEKWKEETIRNTSQLQFDQEFGNCFLGTGHTLIDAETLLSLKAEKPIKYLENGALAIYEEVKRDHEYIMVVDVSKGLGQDFSTFSILDITQRPIKQVAVYRNNKITPFLYPTVLVKYGTIYNNAFMIIESNDQGTLVCSGVHELDYEEMYMESTVKADKMGLLMTVKSKRLGCAGFKSMLESGKLKVVDADTIREISTFSVKGKSYEATEGNTDDLVMGLVGFGYYATTSHFKAETDIDIASMMHGAEIKEIENDMPDIGIDDGLDFIPHEPDEPYDPWSTSGWSFGDEDQGLYVEDW